jgi:quinoprotein glucose dehydrogenase
MVRYGAAMAALALSWVSVAALGQTHLSGPRGLDGLFSREQTDRGAQAFSGQCASCHTPTQASAYMMERSAGAGFAEYEAKLSQIMPPMTSEPPATQTFVDIMAFLAKTAGAAPGQTAATLETPALRAARFSIGAIAKAPLKPAGPNRDWLAWRGNAAGTGYSDADQIDASNVKSLRIVWRWSAANYGPSPETKSETTPLMVNGVLYATAGLTRSVVAIDAASGETLWVWRPAETQARFDNASRKGSGRGVSYWTDGKDQRIFTVTPGFHLAALDAHTGQPIKGFGRDGQIDLMIGLRGLPKDGSLPDIGSQSPPLVIGNIVVVGPAHLISLRPKSRGNVKGDVRGFDVRTGKLLWTFHSVPQKGEPGYETWAPGTAEIAGNTGTWAPISGDARTGAIFLPVESATSDYYGGERKGANAHASSLVSLDSKTGKIRWEHQLVHHDIWDWDVPAMPILADIPQAGGTVRHAVLQVTKEAFVFAFDRDTGEPLWPIAERPVPASTTPGEQAWPTQPMPTKPLAFDRQGITVDDLIDFTPQLHAEALAAVKPYTLGAFMQPPTVITDSNKGTLSLPSNVGGANWEGGVYDPTTGLLYVGSMSNPDNLSLVKAKEGSDIPWVGGPLNAPTVRGLPVIKPPYGRITAIDMKTGDQAWQMANGDTPAKVANNPALKGLSIPRTGVATRSGLLVTKSLLFSGEGTGGGPTFRAHDKATGEILAEVKLPASQTGDPMTYVWNGRQYIVMVTGDDTHPAELIALALGD